MAWLIDYVNPPFDIQYWNASQRPYEWCNKFMGFCAQLSGFLSADEAWEHLVEPFTRLERDKGFEPRRVSRRPFGLSHAAKATPSV